MRIHSFPFLSLLGLPTTFIGASSTPNALEDFINHGRIDPARPPFTAKSGAHDPLYFALMLTDAQRVTFSRWLMNGAQGSAGNRFFASSYPSHTRDLLSKVNSRDVELCHSVDCCRLLSDFLSIIPQDALKTMGSNCVVEIVSDAVGSTTAQPRGYKVLEYIPDQVLVDNGDIIVTRLGDSLAFVPPKVLDKILQNPGACSQITQNAWAGILVKPSLAALITPSCLEGNGNKLGILGGAQNGPKARNMQATVFEAYKEGLEGPLVSTLSADQVRNLASQIEDGQNPGGFVELTRLNAQGAEGLTLRLLLGFLYEDRGMDASAGLPYLTTNWTMAAWRAVPKDIFDDLTVEDSYAVVSALHHKADLGQPPTSLSKMPPQAYLGKEQVASLLRHPGICAYLEPEIAGKATSISRDCFTSMRASTQAAILAKGGSLPDDALADLDAEKVSEWEFRDLKELSVLNLAARRPNIGALIANLGSDVADKHPCSRLDNVAQLADLPLLQSHISMSCIQNLSFKITDEHLRTLQPRLVYLRPFIQLKRSKPKSFWEDMTVETFHHVISNEAFCAQVDRETFAMINRKALAAINASCLEHLGFLSTLPGEITESFPAEAFSRVRPSQINADFLTLLTPAQLGRIPPEGLAVLTAQAINKLSDAHLAAMEAGQWTHIKPSLFVTFDDRERLRTIPPSATRNWSRIQANLIPRSVLSEITKVQAEVIGQDVSDRELSPLYTLASVSLADLDAQLVLDARLREVGICKTAASILAIILIGAGVLAFFAIIGVGTFLFWSTRNKNVGA